MTKQNVDDIKQKTKKIKVGDIDVEKIRNTLLEGKFKY